MGIVWLGGIQMMFVRSAIVLFLLVSLSGCYGVQSRYSYSAETDFSALRSYSFSPVVDEAFSRPVYADRFRASMDEGLSSRGLIRDEDKPNFIIRVPRIESYVESYQPLYGAVEFNKSVLRVNFLDPDTGRPLWEGVAVSYISPDWAEDRVAKEIDDAVRDLLEGFPPPSAN